MVSDAYWEWKGEREEEGGGVVGVLLFRSIELWPRSVLLWGRLPTRRARDQRSKTGGWRGLLRGGDGGRGEERVAASVGSENWRLGVLVGEGRVNRAGFGDASRP